MVVTIDIRLGKSQYLKEYFREAINIGLRNAITRIVAELRGITPATTGTLRAAFTAKTIPRGIRLRWATPYARYPEEGTPPHIILPVNKKVLKFQAGGRTVFAKRVQHPGQAAQQYSRETATLAKVIMKEEIERALIELIPMVS